MAASGDHRHCKVCGKVTKADAETCSASCAAVRERRVRSAGNYRIILYAAVALLLLVFLGQFLRI